VISPASFNLKTGECLDKARAQGQPQANGGRFIGLFADDYVIGGGRILYASQLNVATKGSFAAWAPDHRSQTLNFGGIPPVWNDQMLAVINFKYGHIATFDSPKLSAAITRGLQRQADGAPFQNNLVTAMNARKEERWLSNLGDASKFEAVALALTPNAVVAVASFQVMSRAKPQWFLIALATEDGRRLFQQELPGDPLPDGLVIDRDGRILVSMLDGSVACYGRKAQ